MVATTRAESIRRASIRKGGGWDEQELWRRRRHREPGTGVPCFDVRGRPRQQRCDRFGSSRRHNADLACRPGPWIQATAGQPWTSSQLPSSISTTMADSTSSARAECWCGCQGEGRRGLSLEGHSGARTGDRRRPADQSLCRGRRNRSPIGLTPPEAAAHRRSGAFRSRHPHQLSTSPASSGRTACRRRNSATEVDETVVAEQRLKGSCPWVFAYNGTEMAFVTDFLWRSPLGLRINAQDTAGVNQTEDWVRNRRRSAGSPRRVL